MSAAKRASTSTRSMRRRLRMSLLIGLAITALVVAVTAAGWLRFLERHMVDWRYQWFAQFNPPPSDRVVHIDIDDNALENVGRWPWPRSTLAQVVDELNNAGAAVIGFDLLFDEPRKLRWEPEDEDTPVNFDRIDDDAILADSLRRLGAGVLAVNPANDPVPGPVTLRAIKALLTQPDMTVDELASELQLNVAETRYIATHISGIKKMVLRDRLFAMFNAASPDALPTLAECRAAILPNIPPGVKATTETELLKGQYDTVRTTILTSRSLPVADDGHGLPHYEKNLAVPVPALADAAATTGSVAYEASPDGRVRTVPLWVTYRDHYYPHFALAMACQYLKVPLDSLRIEPDATIIPDATFPDGTQRTIRMPTTTARPGDGWPRFRQHRLLIPWQTNANHWSMLFAVNGGPGAQHVPIGRMIEMRRLRESVAANRKEIDGVTILLMSHGAAASAFPGQLVADYDALYRQMYDPAGGKVTDGLLAKREKLLAQVLEIVTFLDEQLSSAEKLSPEEVDIRKALTAWQALYGPAEELRLELTQFEAELRRLVDGAICIVGWTATGSLADFVQTSLEPQCPGPVVHGAIVSAILTDHFIARGPLSLDLLLVAVVGIIATWIASRFAPVGALIITAGFVVLYFMVNGMVLFDLYNTQVAAAAPMTAAVLAWVGVTVFRLVAEQREKMRITRQFRNYVSPDLVDSLVGNPATIKTGRHELTCLFSDIAGFTSVSEKLPAEQTISLLNRYLSALTDHAMDGHGYVNKYLGDGLMAVWGAPLENPRHALDCCRSALQCMVALHELNDAPDLKELPNLFMRVGIATGPMMVGDCGAPPRRSDYTVIGDTVNLASRLEQANKQFGTQVLINSRTHELVQEHMLTRPIGRIVVVGRSQPEPVYELLADFSSASDEQRAIADATTKAVEAYYAAEFAAAIDAFEELASRFGRIKLIDRYIESCREHIEQHTTAEQHDGAIILTEK